MPCIATGGAVPSEDEIALVVGGRAVYERDDVAALCAHQFCVVVPRPAFARATGIASTDDDFDMGEVLYLDGTFPCSSRRLDRTRDAARIAKWCADIRAVLPRDCGAIEAPLSPVGKGGVASHRVFTRLATSEFDGTPTRVAIPGSFCHPRNTRTPVSFVPVFDGTYGVAAENIQRCELRAYPTAPPDDERRLARYIRPIVPLIRTHPDERVVDDGDDSDYTGNDADEPPSPRATLSFVAAAEDDESDEEREAIDPPPEAVAYVYADSVKACQPALEALAARKGCSLEHLPCCACCLYVFRRVRP